MKRLDQICKNVLQNALRFTGRLRVVEAPSSADNNEYDTGYHPRVIIAYALDDIDNRGGGDERSNSRSSDGSGSEHSSAKKWEKTRRLAACFDPLDGSGNADADICTGTVVRNTSLSSFCSHSRPYCFLVLVDPSVSLSFCSDKSVA
jgi:fructose-1,6-bisphosphatase I